MKLSSLNRQELQHLMRSSKKLEHATQHYPSRGQSAVQEIYKTTVGNLFLKKVSATNHENCGIKPEYGTLAEREFWAYSLAKHLGLLVPELVLFDKNTTIQNWLNLPDASIYSSREGKLIFTAPNVFECSIFDWLTGQADRHDANYLYDYPNKKIILIDSSFCFLKYDGDMPHYLKIFEYGSQVELEQKHHGSLLVKLKKLSESELFQMVPLRTLEEKKALLKRKQQLALVQSLEDIICLYRGVKK